MPTGPERGSRTPAGGRRGRAAAPSCKPWRGRRTRGRAQRAQDERARPQAPRGTNSPQRHARECL
eukprot:15230574-Alexandrium_andersonii.AAC.1